MSFVERIITTTSRRGKQRILVHRSKSIVAVVLSICSDTTATDAKSSQNRDNDTNNDTSTKSSSDDGRGREDVGTACIDQDASVISANTVDTTNDRHVIGARIIRSVRINSFRGVISSDGTDDVFLHASHERSADQVRTSLVAVRTYDLLVDATENWIARVIGTIVVVIAIACVVCSGDTTEDGVAEGGGTFGLVPLARRRENAGTVNAFG